MEVVWSIRRHLEVVLDYRRFHIGNEFANRPPMFRSLGGISASAIPVALRLKAKIAGALMHSGALNPHPRNKSVAPIYEFGSFIYL